VNTVTAAMSLRGWYPTLTAVTPRFRVDTGADQADFDGHASSWVRVSGTADVFDTSMKALMARGRVIPNRQTLQLPACPCRE